MPTQAPDIGRAKRWQAVRRKIRLADPDERYQLLRYFGNEIRVLTPMAVKESTGTWDMNAATEIMSAQGTLMGGWWQADPTNPKWPGRDRLFLGRREDLPGVCCCLAILGFFPADRVASLIDGVLTDGREAAIPGIEHPGADPEEIPALAWESAIESARSKRRWRDYLGMDAGRQWAEKSWRESPAVWRTFALLDALSPAAADLMHYPARAGDAPAGFVTLIMVNRTEAPSLADEWQAAGWEASVVAKNDFQSLYDALATARDDRPTAIMLGIGQSPSFVSRTVRRVREPTLLGELSDEQFHAIMGESIQF